MKRALPLLAFMAGAVLLVGCSRSATPEPSPEPGPGQTEVAPAVEATEPSTVEPATAVAFGQATVRFEQPTANEQVTGAVEVCLTAESVLIAPASDDSPGSGHFVVLVDPSQDALLAIGSGTREVLPNDATHVHLDDGGSCVTLDLTTGEHTLVAVVADSDEMPLRPPVMDLVAVTVVAPAAEATAAPATETTAAP